MPAAPPPREAVRPAQCHSSLHAGGSRGGSGRQGISRRSNTRPGSWALVLSIAVLCIGSLEAEQQSHQVAASPAQRCMCVWLTAFYSTADMKSPCLVSPWHASRLAASCVATSFSACSLTVQPHRTASPQAEHFWHCLADFGRGTLRRLITVVFDRHALQALIVSIAYVCALQALQLPQARYVQIRSLQ